MIHRRSIVYNIQWCGIIYVCTYTRVKIFRGLRPLDPRQGLCPCTPPGGPKAGPWTPPKIGSRLRARSAHMFAPPKKIGSRLRARYVRSAHMFAQKKSARASRSLCALRAHVCPPHNQSLPPSCPPHFLNPGAATGPCTNLLQLDAERQSQLKHTPFSLIFGPS